MDAGVIVSWLRENQKALLVSIGLAGVWALVISYWKNDMAKNMVTLPKLEETEFDYIVVGGGTAGCLVASRLSEDPDCSVLLVEEGSVYNHLEVRSPLVWDFAWQIPGLNWKFLTTAQANLNDRELTLYRGRLLGGNGNVDNLLFHRGVQQDYEKWATTHGLKGWSYAELLPYFKKHENFDCSTKDASQRGSSGEMSVEKLTNLSEVGNSFIKACQESNLGLVDHYDYNHTRPHGVSYAQFTTKDKLRVESAASFLKPICRSRQNLSIVVNTAATKLLMEDNTVKGIEFVDVNNTGKITARKEVIVCCGPINSPLLLMRSGIGPKEHLQEKEIDCVVDLPVGENLKDQLVAPLSFTVHHARQTTETTAKAKSLNLLMHLLLYFLKKGGLYLPFFEASALEYVEDDTTPSLQYLATARNFHDCFKTLSFDAEIQAGISLVPVLLNPKSSGSVKLNSSEPFDYPIINPNYFENADDRDTLAYGAMRCYEISQNKGFCPVVKSWIRPSEHEDVDEKDISYWNEFVTLRAQSANHQIGTCRMGSDPVNSVVDHELRVHGIKNLRVIDSSVIPEHVSSSNPRAVTLVIAEKGVAMIKESNQ